MTTSTVSDGELLEGLRDSPAGQKLMHERERERLTRRRELAVELAEIERGMEDNAPRLRAVERRHVEQVRAAQERLQKLQGEYGGLEEQQERNRLAGQRARVEDELLRSAPSAIDAFVAEMICAEGLTRRRISIGASEGRDPYTGHERPRKGNAASVKECLAVIGDARRQAEGLKLQAFDAEELDKRLGQLRAGIPDVEA